jgi:hypothetical protein
MKTLLDHGFTAQPVRSVILSQFFLCSWKFEFMRALPSVIHHPGKAGAAIKFFKKLTHREPVISICFKTFRFQFKISGAETHQPIPSLLTLSFRSIYRETIVWLFRSRTIISTIIRTIILPDKSADPAQHQAPRRLYLQTAHFKKTEIRTLTLRTAPSPPPHSIDNLQPVKNGRKGNRKIYLVANGDLRLSANQKCWSEQASMENLLTKAFATEGAKVVRAHLFDEAKGHGFIDSQKMGLEVFRKIPNDAPLIIAEAVWQYSHHLLPGLWTHRGPILTVANWSGTWPGLVGMLNLNGSLTKAGIPYSTIWSERFNDRFFTQAVREWLNTGVIHHDQQHVRSLDLVKLPADDENLGRNFARRFRTQKSIIGIFDEGCMGMFNAIIPDDLLHATGVFKERLSQSSLFAEMQRVSDNEAEEVYRWLTKKGMTFKLGSNEETDLTGNQVLQQCKMYIAALRIADDFGCSAIGIQYQQGLKDLAPASDLVEGLLNNVDRPPVKRDGKTLFAGEALPHFNEVDECAGLDGLVTYKLWRELGFAPENTLHDLRWGQQYRNGKLDAYVWVFLISGAAPPAHFIAGYKRASSERQPPMYFRLGGGTVKGISKPGHIVWSRVFVMNGALHCDLGIAEVVELPPEETERRWRETTPQWPIMHAVLKGITRDQMMARHKANHIQVVYAPSEKQAQRACRIKAAALAELGLKVHFCGEVNLSA